VPGDYNSGVNNENAKLFQSDQNLNWMTDLVKSYIFIKAILAITTFPS